MTSIVKVCVRVPADRKEELLAFAESLRAGHAARRAPGWDARLIHEIADQQFGGLLGMFEHHGWPESGNQMLPAVQRHVKDTYGSIEAFEAKVRHAGRRAPGWDAKLIHEIANQRFGGLAEMFEHHGWPERGSEMLQSVQRHVKTDYGSIEAFEAQARPAHS